MRRYLIVANQTLGSEDLVALVRRRAASEPSEFLLVVPATPVLELVPGLAGIEMGGAVVLPSSVEDARSQAGERLGQALDDLREAGVAVDGLVGDPNPVRAVEVVMRGRQFDEIIVSTLPSRLSQWLRADLPRRLEHRTGLPVTQVTENR